ncbi:MAG: hypothetical protein AB7V00_04385 [Bacilli bacterium]
MRKINLFLMLCLLLIMTGCYNYSSGSQYGKLIDIKFYNEASEEITGEFIDYFEFREQFEADNLLNLHYEIKPLNSPAPVELFYCASVTNNSELTVRFTIEPHNDYVFSSLTINNQKVTSEGFVSIEEIDGLIYVDYLCSNITNDNNLFEINYLEMKKDIQDKTYYRNGSQWVEGRTYYSGFYFNIGE